jgi:uncharacterized protein YndB with AHSA1/START domain
LPRFAADRVLLAPLDDVWAFLAEPYNLADWWPGISVVEPDRRGLVPGARWSLRASDSLPSASILPLGPGMFGLFKRPGASGTLLVTEVVPGRRFAFQLVAERIAAELELEAVERGRTRVSLLVDAPWTMMRRSFPRYALRRLYDLIQTSAEA